ncbi:MAG: NAD-dependent epimerase/dehydratase, CDP-paratose 2-epimerase [Candidatus Gottesmanbacteria bacterium GW2011_GWA2_43_14]|uniref:NAD-dependent epimerase/dehydratase, CDP-paratose 2-epimerase n=1 Tax=Candidatus Gottesmanbacteria bacterium GW2011_GWA2_43_14 TaxID=1618443 RepID=A0A0G1FUK0_9BACT|nr:MAG: NAD-dependent epimerase/dehydratase, CDP-paratose 2-epimerase [Candidatus Gottesmanbacteria bacterium GW2011_GWA2_43_14]
MNNRLLITGGAGFIGSNLAAYFLKKKYRVAVLDNLSRQGSRVNLDWLKGTGSVEFINGDIRQPEILNKAVRGRDIIFHLAGQVAVTTSVEDPRTDFDINMAGTFNLLEAVRKNKIKPIIIYASTNKVYGGMENLKIIEKKDGYLYADYPNGISEEFNLDFHSPYGCSKGAADQYMHDYSRIYDLPTVVFRQSCIYGPRQFGVEDQGWVAWFIIAVLLGKPITIYGDGKQVRDILYITDLVRLFETTVRKIDRARGKVFNVGGGSKNLLSVWSKFGPMLEDLYGKKIKVKYDNWRPGDQKVYISDIRKAEKTLGWKPEVSVEEGVGKLYRWVKNNKDIFI